MVHQEICIIVYIVDVRFINGKLILKRILWYINAHANATK